MTSKVHDTADGGTGGDVVQLIDVPADTMIVSGVLEVLEARGIVSPSYIKAENKSRIKNVNRGKAKGGKIKK